MYDVLGTGIEAEFSWRYGVVGVYRDRELPLLRIYPCPFIRFTVTYKFKRWAQQQAKVSGDT